MLKVASRRTFVWALNPGAFGIVAAALLVLGARVASAQPLGEAVVLPLGLGELTPTLEAAEAVENALLEQGAALIPLHDARDRFAGHSRAPQQTSESDLEALAASARQASEHVAFGRTAAAQKSVREVITRAERTLESLNRETAAARHVLDACLALVRSALQEGNREAALAQATRCRRLVPDLAPSAAAHPANVVGVLAEADNLLRRMRIGKLTVRSVPEEHCSVYLNGRHLGTTPFDLDRAAAGDYRVQVECGSSPGRVHVLRLGDEPASLRVNGDFDRAVRTEPRLALQYESLPRLHEQALEHALELGNEIGASDVVLVELVEGRLVMSRVQVEHRRLVARASARWGRGVKSEPLERAVAALLEGRLEAGALEVVPPGEPLQAAAPAPVAGPVEPPVGVSDDAPAPAELARAVEPPAGSGVDRRPTRVWPWVVGGLQLGLAVASFAGTAVYMGKLHGKGQRLRAINPEDLAYTRLVAEWDDARPHPYALAAVGSALATSGALTLLLTRPPSAFPGWASALWAAGSLGGAIWGITDIARGEACGNDLIERIGCSKGREQRERGGVVLLSSLTLLVVPTVQLARQLGARHGPHALRLAPHVQAARGLLEVGVNLRF
jgi:PEGA domain